MYRRIIKLDDCLDPHCMYNTCMRAHNTDDVYRKCHGNVLCSPQAHQVCLLKGFAAFLCHTLRTLASEVRYGICARTYSIPVLFLWPMCIPWHEVWAIDACGGQLALVCKLRRSSHCCLLWISRMLTDPLVSLSGFDVGDASSCAKCNESGNVPSQSFQLLCRLRERGRMTTH